MQRYTNLLMSTYRENGDFVELLRPSRHSALHRLLPSKLALYFENLVLFPLAVFLKSKQFEIAHIADHSDSPWTFACRTRTIVTVHDLIAVRSALGMIDDHRTRLSGKVYQRLITHGLRRADLALAISNVTLSHVEQLLPSLPVALLPNPVVVAVRNAVPVKTLPHSPEEAPFLLVVSSGGWRKRRDRAVRLWSAAAKLRPGLKLVIVGEELSAHEMELAGLDSSLKHGQIENMRRVDDSRLSALYSSCIALLQLSEHEGFGWPVVEANLNGRAAICSDLPIFHEVGPRNVFIDTTRLEESAERAIARAESPAVREAVRHDAEERTVEQFRARLSVLIHDRDGVGAEL